MNQRLAAIRQVVAWALVAPMLLVAASFAHDLMRCRLTGAVIEDCACPDGEAARAPQAQIAEQSCCEREAVTPVVAVGGQPPADALLRAPMVVKMACAEPAYHPPYRLLARPVVANAGLHGGGMTLLLRKRAFLI